MRKVHCAVITFSSITYKLKKWKQEFCYEHMSKIQVYLQTKEMETRNLL